MGIHEKLLEKDCIIRGDRSREYRERLSFITRIFIDRIAIVPPLDTVVNALGGHPPFFVLAWV